MTFYLKPPRGRIELDRMIDCLQQRLQFVTSVVEHHERFQTPKNLSYFVEGTAIDRTSHYLLRLVSVESYTFQQHVLQAETALFRKRLEYFDIKNYQMLLRVCQQHSSELIGSRNCLTDSYKVFLQSVENVCDDMLRKPGGIQHAFGENHSVSCTAMHIKVPYRSCLKLVATRRVRLRQGMALVPCGVWRTLLVDMFQLHLRHGYEDMVFSGCHREALNDPRMMQLTRLMSFNFKELDKKPDVSLTKTDLTCEQVTERHKMFPPCVTTMLDSLRTHHRLGHHPRIALTLFLKEAGMPVKEALEFWKSELSKPGCKHGGPSCSHSWQKDERKYVYSIRHLYGLEGARKNYSAPCCTTIQSQLLAPGAVGGCPFTKLPSEKLLPVLELEESEVTAEILRLASEKKSSEACHCLMQARLSQISRGKVQEVMRFSKPSQFYAICRNKSLEF